MSQSIVPDTFSETDYLGLMLDYDGTLTPIALRPDEAILAPERSILLQKLTQSSRIRLAIVSGRPVQQLETIFKGLLKNPVFLCGLHGGEIKQYPEGLILRTPSVSHRTHLSNFKTRLTNSLNIKGLLQSVLLEDKIYSLALHYRLAPREDKESAIQCFQSIYHASDTLQEAYRLQPGKEVLELLPATFDKGSCVQFLVHLWQEIHPDKQFCFTYAGDDLTDEHAFAMIRQLEGRAVRIGPAEPESQANLHLNSIDELYQELESLLLSQHEHLLF